MDFNLVMLQRNRALRNCRWSVCCPVRVKALINSVASRIALGCAVLGIFSRTEKLLKVLQLLLLQGYGCNCRQGTEDLPLTCPADREGLDRDRDVFPDKATERKILSLAIKCPSEGCQWTGELRSIEVHLASCLFKLVPCTNENCRVTVQMRHLEEHVTITCPWRILECDHCSEPRPECTMQYHIGLCRKFPVTCPSNCGASIPRETVPNHIKADCPLAIISCPYEKMGCETKVQREQVESHLQSAMRIHLDLACLRLKETEETTRKLEEKLDTRIFIWKIKHFSEIFREAKAGEKESIESAPFYTDRTESYGYKLKVKVFPNGSGPGINTHLSVYIVVMKGEYDAILPWPLKTKVKFTLIDQQEDLAERENVIEQIIPDKTSKCFSRPVKEENVGRGFGKFILHLNLFSRRYLVDDTLFLQVEVGP